MDYSRRDLGLILPVLLAGRAEAANAGLPSECYSFDALAVKANPRTHNETRAVLKGDTTSGCPIELHITTLAAGQMPHPQHHHVHEEMVMLQKGTLEVTIAGKSSRIGPGSVAWVHSNEEHGWKNVGDTPAQYFVLAIGNEKAP
jgi:quercetin dioxygenase-like cupin family protein